MWLNLCTWNCILIILGVVQVSTQDVQPTNQDLMKESTLKEKLSNILQNELSELLMEKLSIIIDENLPDLLQEKLSDVNYHLRKLGTTLTEVKEDLAFVRGNAESMDAEMEAFEERSSLALIATKKVLSQQEQTFRELNEIKKNISEEVIVGKLLQEEAFLEINSFWKNVSLEFQTEKVFQKQSFNELNRMGNNISEEIQAEKLLIEQTFSEMNKTENNISDILSQNISIEVQTGKLLQEKTFTKINGIEQKLSEDFLELNDKVEFLEKNVNETSIVTYDLIQNVTQDINIIKNKVILMEDNFVNIETFKRDTSESFQTLTDDIGTIKEAIITVEISKTALKCQIPNTDGFFMSPGNSGQCFKIIKDQKVTWEQAKAKCESEGLLMAKPKDAVPLRKYIMDTYGASDWVHLRAKFNGSVYRWERDGVAISNSDPLWYQRNPYSLDEGMCLAMMLYKSNWERSPNSPYHANPCYVTKYTLCEFVMQ